MEQVVVGKLPSRVRSWLIKSHCTQSPPRTCCERDRGTGCGRGERPGAGVRPAGVAPAASGRGETLEVGVLAARLRHGDGGQHEGDRVLAPHHALRLLL